MYKLHIEPISFAIKTPLLFSQIKALSDKFNMPLLDLGSNIWKLKFEEDLWEEKWEMEPYPEGTCTKVLTETGSLIFIIEDNKASHFECLNAQLDRGCELDSLISLMEWEFDIKFRTLSDHLSMVEYAASLKNMRTS